MAHLVIHFGDEVECFELTQDKLTIGRVEGNSIRIDNTFVSRRHCKIVKTRDGGHRLCDLKSSNGTLIDGEPIKQVDLRPGMSFTVGAARFVYEAKHMRNVETVAQESNAELHKLADILSPVTIKRENIKPPPVRKPAAVATGGSNGNSNGGGFTEDDFNFEDNYEQTLSQPDWVVSSVQSLSEFGQDVGFGVDDITILNARGQMMQPAANAASQAAESITLLRTMLYGCCRAGASDLHLEPKRDVGQLRCRIDGVMVQLLQLSCDQTRQLIGVTKVLCDIDIAKKAIVQEGHFSLVTPRGRVDYRVSLTPSIYGQKLVVRVLDPANAPHRLRDLGLSSHMQQQLLNITRQDSGMLLTTGPTGSGKTTTLYAALREIDATMRNIVTIEDPVEYEIEGVTQIPVNDGQGQDFNTLLRSVLRQDPDVIVVGEIRDSETATTAMRAATTGHTVMTTLHTKDSIGAIFRLLDLGVEPFLVASSLNVVMAQRLARRLCPNCKEHRQPTTNQQMRLGRALEGAPKLYAPVGCPTCFGTGYSGRVGVWEMLTFNDELRDVILKSPTLSEIRRAVVNTIFTTLRDFGNRLILTGQTSFEEIDRVVGIEP